jgi:uncharacterized protein YdeI (YjbR/CyaY-like superfamily)
MAMNPDPRVDAYVANSAEFARPILRHLRALIHQGCPAAQETIKWGFPFFTHEGILCFMAAHKQHCAFGFWNPGMRAILQKDRKDLREDLRRITSPRDLPKDRTWRRYIREAARLNEAGGPAPAPRPAKPAARIPTDLAAALRKNKAAAATFKKFSPSGRNEYIEWLTAAKRPETRTQRLATTIAWLAEGKPRHWKYQKR